MDGIRVRLFRDFGPSACKIWSLGRSELCDLKLDGAIRMVNVKIMRRQHVASLHGL